MHHGAPAGRALDRKASHRPVVDHGGQGDEDRIDGTRQRPRVTADHGDAENLMLSTGTGPSADFRRILVRCSRRKHRAGDTRTGPAIRMMRRADFLSGVAALVLAIALVLFGSLWLALVSTVLLAGGKLGNALAPQGCWPVRVEYLGLARTTLSREFDLFRLVPLLSRIPAIVAILMEIVRLLAIGSPGMALHLSQPTVLLVCYLLWGRADLLLLRR